MINQLGLLLLLLQRANLTPVVDLTHFAFCTEGFLFILKKNLCDMIGLFHSHISKSVALQFDWVVKV